MAKKVKFYFLTKQSLKEDDDYENDDSLSSNQGTDKNQKDGNANDQILIQKLN